MLDTACKQRFQLFKEKIRKEVYNNDEYMFGNKYKMVVVKDKLKEGRVASMDELV
jgi:CTP:phosphocholine cytidylyltransferase-like protein